MFPTSLVYFLSSYLVCASFCCEVGFLWGLLSGFYLITNENQEAFVSSWGRKERAHRSVFFLIGTGSTDWTIESGTAACETGFGTWLCIKLKGVLFFNFMVSNIIFECPGDSQWTRTSGSWHYFATSVCYRKPRRRVSLWQWNSAFQLKTEIPVSNPEPHSPRASRLYMEYLQFERH